MEYGICSFFSSRHIFSYDRGKSYFRRDECVKTNASNDFHTFRGWSRAVKPAILDGIKREMNPQLNDEFWLKPKRAIFDLFSVEIWAGGGILIFHFNNTH